MPRTPVAHAPRTTGAPRTLAIVALVLSIGTVVAFGLLLRALIVIPPGWYLGALALAVVLAAVAVVRSRGRGRRWLPVTALVASGVLLVLGGAFNFVLARVPTAPSAFVIGQPAPDFTLPDAAGRPVRLGEFRGRQPVVLVFYRGYW